MTTTLLHWILPVDKRNDNGTPDLYHRNTFVLCKNLFTSWNGLKARHPLLALWGKALSFCSNPNRSKTSTLCPRVCVQVGKHTESSVSFRYAPGFTFHRALLCLTCAWTQLSRLPMTCEKFGFCSVSHEHLCRLPVSQGCVTNLSSPCRPTSFPGCPC